MKRRSFLATLLAAFFAPWKTATRKLKASYTVETAEQLRRVHGLICIPYIPFYTTPILYLPLVTVETRRVQGALRPRDSLRRQLRLNSLGLPVSLEEAALGRPSNSRPQREVRFRERVREKDYSASRLRWNYRSAMRWARFNNARTSQSRRIRSRSS